MLKNKTSSKLFTEEIVAPGHGNGTLRKKKGKVVITGRFGGPGGVEVTKTGRALLQKVGLCLPRSSAHVLQAKRVSPLEQTRVCRAFADT